MPQPSPATPVARILARLDDALGAKMPPRGIERVVGPGLAEMTVRRWRDGVSAPTGRKAELFAEAMGLNAEHVMRWAALPADWPPPAVVERFDAQRKPVGRPPKLPDRPAPAKQTPIQRVLDRLDEALWELNGDESRTPMSNRGLERLVPVSQTQLGRWRNGQPVLRTDVGERFARAVGLEVGHVLGVLDLPPPGGAWPPPALVRRMMEEHKHAGRPSKGIEADKNRGPPPAAAREVGKLRAVMTRLDALATAMAEDHRLVMTRLERVERALSRPIIDGA